jgi:thiosulfate/3-mercaptopyruvate sulfurtransferase
VLTAAGIGNVRILDGGLAAWAAAGGALQAQAPRLRPGDVSAVHDDLYAGARATLTAQQVGDGEVTLLLDARSPQRFRGEFEPVDPVAGHIPGARNVPSTLVLADDGSFLADADLRALWADIGVAGNDVGVYCGSGVTASVVLAALSANGIDGALFPGSWSQWCS